MNHFILADCNNFYASCERLFNPKLEGIPLIVLSNNDGCVVARSQEAKKIGIQMGQPYFQIKDFCKKNKVAVFSSNYQLYGDLSQRVMNILSEVSHEIEIYSIDEAFLKYPNSMDSENLFNTCLELRKKVKKWVGLPISLGIAPTKTLAKIANDLAKKDKAGVFDLRSSQVQNEILKNYPIGSVWGIGSRLTERMRGIGIRTALDFKEMDPHRIKKAMGIVGERMLWELRGSSCLDLLEPKNRQSITCSRSFGNVVTEKNELAEALATFASSACMKLREQGSCAKAIYVFLEATLDSGLGTRRQYCQTKILAFPTSNTSQIITAAKMVLEQIFVANERYKKCGVVLLDLISEDLVIPDLFLGGIDPKSKAVMRVVDSLNARFGKDTIFFGATGGGGGLDGGIGPQWKMSNNKRSQYNTTDWGSLPIVKA